MIWTPLELKEFGDHVVYDQEQKQDTQDKAYPTCPELAYLVRCGIYFLSNQVLSKDDFVVPISNSGWQKYFKPPQKLQVYDDEQKHHESDLMGRAAGRGRNCSDGSRIIGHKAVLITTRINSTIDNYHPPLPASPSTTSTTTIRREKKKRRPITPPPLDSQPLWEANEIQLRGFPEALEKTQPSLLSSDWQTLWR
ncbi:unnamed protein product [Camellia sinensis]